MPIPLPDGQRITVIHTVYDYPYTMPTMQMATDHYSIGYVVSGDRCTITPLFSYRYHAGDVALSPPLLFHRTVSESSAPYERYLIKFAPDMLQPLKEHTDENIIDTLYNERVCHFSKASQIKILGMFQDMYEEFNKQHPYTELILQGMLLRLFTTTWEERLPENTAVYHSTKLTEPIIDALYYMETNYGKNLTLEELAQKAHLSTAYFSRLFSAQLGKSFSEYLGDIRLRHVQILLTQSDKSVMDIAMETGYCNGDYLSAQFRKKVGMTPSEYRKKHRATAPSPKQ
ncbi:MAG: AraC family transcriptional regulator [Lachnospiraceae bacterium]|nr:AraC family transcriptional regulator [Lachnospiraceae bacterium]